jgi:hypothetical protein
MHAINVDADLVGDEAANSVAASDVVAGGEPAQGTFPAAPAPPGCEQPQAPARPTSGTHHRPARSRSGAKAGWCHDLVSWEAGGDSDP